MNNSNIEEKAIKEMINHAFHDEGFELNLEEDILKRVQLQQNTFVEIEKVKQKAKMCLRICLGLLILYGIVCTYMFAEPKADMMQTDASILAFNMCLVVGLFLVYFQSVSLKSDARSVLKQ